MSARRELAETYEAQDLIIQAAQDAKRVATQDYRAVLDKAGMDKDAIKTEVEGFKKAYRRKMDGKKKGTEAVEHVDAVADEIFLEITSPAPRATRVASAVPEHDPETGEIIEPLSAPQTERDLTVAPPEPTGQVAPIQPETANEAAGTRPDPSMSERTAPAPVQQSSAGNSATPGGVTVVGTESGTVTTFIPKPLRPHCQRPERCGGQGRQHCYSCRVAAEQSGAVA